MYRASRRWPGRQELLLRRWRKLVVYRVVPGEVQVLAFFDQRQDLSRVYPEAE
jgi:plasmid stabilization system protein ParE